MQPFEGSGVPQGQLCAARVCTSNEALPPKPCATDEVIIKAAEASSTLRKVFKKGIF